MEDAVGFKAFRLADMHTSPTCNFQGIANRLRDVVNWQAPQGVMGVYPKRNSESAFGDVRIGREHQIDAIEQVAHLFAG